MAMTVLSVCQSSVNTKRHVTERSDAMSRVATWRSVVKELKKKFCLILPFERRHRGRRPWQTECTSVLWTRCVMELIKATRWIASQLDGGKKNWFRLLWRTQREKFSFTFADLTQIFERKNKLSGKKCSWIWGRERKKNSGVNAQ